ncbi:MAG: hypothetical protein RSD74_01395 [Angelakisella sp.]
MKDNIVVSTEYVVEINDENTCNFIRQVDVFDTYEKAVAYTENHSDCGDGEYYNIIFIDYNKDGDEVGFGTVC